MMEIYKHAYRFSTSKPQSIVARHPLANWSVATTANGVPLSNRFPCAVTAVGSSLETAVLQQSTTRYHASDANAIGTQMGQCRYSVLILQLVQTRVKRECAYQSMATSIPRMVYLWGASRSVPPTITAHTHREQAQLCRSRTSQGRPSSRADQHQLLGCCLQKILRGGGLGSKRTR